MGTPLGSKYVPYTYMDPLGKKNCKESPMLTRDPPHPEALHLERFRVELFGLSI